MKTPCCNYEVSDAEKGVHYPVMWNEFNGVVQCHNCGEVYTPVSQSQAYQLAREHVMRWVSMECKRMLERLDEARQAMASSASCGADNPTPSAETYPDPAA